MKLSQNSFIICIVSLISLLTFLSCTRYTFPANPMFVSSAESIAIKFSPYPFVRKIKCGHFYSSSFNRGFTKIEKNGSDDKYTEKKTQKITFSLMDTSNSTSEVDLCYYSEENISKSILQIGSGTTYTIQTICKEVKGTMKVNDKQFELMLFNPHTVENNEMSSFVQNNGTLIKINKLYKSILGNKIVVGYELLINNETIGVVENFKNIIFVKKFLDDSTKFILVNVAVALTVF